MANETAIFNGLLQGALNANGFTLTGLPSLNFGSTATGLTLFNTADEATNFERASIKWAANIFTLDVTRGGTGTARNFQLTIGNNAASGIPVLISLLPTVTQTGTAGYTALLLNVTESSVGSGTKTLLDIQVDGASKFNLSKVALTVGDSTVTTQGQTLFLQSGYAGTLLPFAAFDGRGKNNAGTLTTGGFFLMRWTDPTAGAEKSTFDFQNLQSGTVVRAFALNGNGFGLFPSGQALHFYNTLDETTNFERAELKWASNVFTLAIGKGGTGLGRKLSITLAGEVSSSGVQTLVSILPTVAQSGTAGYTAFLLNVTESSVGSGDKLLARWQVGGADMLLMSATGQLAIPGNISVGYSGTVAQLAGVTTAILNTDGVFLTAANFATPSVIFRRSSSTADNKIWSTQINASTDLRFVLYADDMTTNGSWLQVIRAGIVPVKLVFPVADFGFGLALGGTPVARLHILEATLNDPVFALESTTAIDPVHEEIRHGRVITTDATVTAALVLVLSASRTYNIHVRVYARRTGGAAGTAEDAAGYFVRGTFKVVGGNSVLVGALVTDTAAEDQAGWDATLAIVGGTANVAVNVTGAANNNVTWHVIASVAYVGA